MGGIKQLADIKEPQQYFRRQDKKMNIDTLLLDWEEVNQIAINDYSELKELIGMKLHYMEPCLYAGENDYCAIFLYFIDDVGNQKVLMIDADEHQLMKIKMLLME